MEDASGSLTPAVEVDHSRQRPLAQIQTPLRTIGDSLDQLNLLIRRHPSQVDDREDLIDLDRRIELAPAFAGLIEAQPQPVVMFEQFLDSLGQSYDLAPSLHPQQDALVIVLWLARLLGEEPALDRGQRQFP